MKKLALLIVILQIALMTATVNGHQLIKDRDGKVGVILHIEPNHTPKQGESSELFLDLQDLKAETVKITIANGSASDTIGPLKVDGADIEIPHKFKSGGDHVIKFEVKTTDSTYDFFAEQYVSSAEEKAEESGAYKKSIRTPSIVIGILALCVGIIIGLRKKTK